MVTSWSTASVKITQWSKNSVVERALSSYHCGLGSNSRSNFRSRLTLLMAPPFSDGLSPCSPVFLILQPFKFSFHLNARVRELSLLCFVGTLITGALHAMKCSEILPKIFRDEYTSIYRDFQKRGQPYEEYRNFWKFLTGTFRRIWLSQGLLTFLRKFTFKFFRQSSEFLETFPASFRSICPRYEIFGIFGWMASARRSHLFYRQQRLAVVGGKCQKSISLGRQVTDLRRYKSVILKHNW